MYTVIVWNTLPGQIYNCKTTSVFRVHSSQFSTLNYELQVLLLGTTNLSDFPIVYMHVLCCLYNNKGHVSIHLFIYLFIYLFINLFLALVYLFLTGRAYTDNLIIRL